MRFRLALAAAAALWTSLAVSAHAGDLSGITGFDEFAEEHPGIASSLKHHPSLAHDSEYLKQHESLTQFLRTHPLAKIELDGEDDEDSPAAELKAAEQDERAAQMEERRRLQQQHHTSWPPPLEDE